MSTHRRAIALIVLVSVLTTGCGAIQPTATMMPTASATPLPPTPTPMVSPVPTGVDMSPEARAYLDQALVIMQEHAMHRDRVDWEAVRAKAYRKAWGARTPADTYAAIELALRELGDQHSYLMSPDRVAELEDGSMATASPDPWGEILESRLGYLFVPGWAGLGDLANGHATRIQQIVRELDADAPCGWIVDLRENTGEACGPCWPALGQSWERVAWGPLSAPTGSRWIGSTSMARPRWETPCRRRLRARHMYWQSRYRRSPC